MTVVRKKVRRKVRARPRAKPATAARSKAKRIEQVPSGYTKTMTGLVVPTNVAKVVDPSKLRKGLRDAHRAIADLLEELAGSLGDGFAVREIELTASFSADGKFLGFGVGGAATVTVRMGPE